MNLWLGLLLASLYVFVVIGIAEALRRLAGWGPELTRKIVHVGVGMLIWIVPFLFDSATPFVATALLFSVLTLADNRLHFFKSMQSKDDGSNLGTFYFPLAAAAVAWLFWDAPALMVAALMPLTWGDGMAEVVGRAWGRHRYQFFGHTRSLEGTAAFIVFGFVATLIALLLYPSPYALTLATALPLALVLIAVTAVVEAVSIAGLDNLTITGTAIGILLLWPF